MYVSNRFGIRTVDPSQYQRVIKDGFDGSEYIISGPREMTFAEACRADWQFESTSPKSKWYIRDDKGNDVTEKPLESAEGIFILVPEYSTDTSREDSDDSDEYSSIHDSVTYYD